MRTSKKYIELAKDGNKRTVLCAIAEPVSRKYVVVVGDIYLDDDNDVRFKTKSFGHVYELKVDNYPNAEFRAVTMANRKILNAICSFKNLQS